MLSQRERETLYFAEERNLRVKTEFVLKDDITPSKTYSWKQWPFPDLPIIASYKTQSELRNIIIKILDNLPKIEFPPLKFWQGDYWLDWIDKQNSYEVIVRTYDSKYVIVPTLEGYILYDVNRPTKFNILQYDSRDLIREGFDGDEILTIDVNHRVFNVGLIGVNVYHYQFPLDYFINGREVSREEYIKYQKDLAHLAGQEMEKYTIKDLAGVMSSYLDEKIRL